MFNLLLKLLTVVYIHVVTNKFGIIMILLVDY